MALHKISSKDKVSKLKARSHTTGRIGFTKDTSDGMNLELSDYVNLYADDDKNPLHIYIAHSSSDEEGSYQIKGDPNYLFFNAKNFFELIGFEFKTRAIEYEIARANVDGQDVWELTGELTKPRKSKKSQQ